MKKGRSTFVVGLLQVHYSSEESTSYERGYKGGRENGRMDEGRMLLVCKCKIDQMILLNINSIYLIL